MPSSEDTKKNEKLLKEFKMNELRKELQA